MVCGCSIGILLLYVLCLPHHITYWVCGCSIEILLLYDLLLKACFKMYPTWSFLVAACVNVFGRPRVAMSTSSSQLLVVTSASRMRAFAFAGRAHSEPPAARHLSADEAEEGICCKCWPISKTRLTYNVQAAKNTSTRVVGYAQQAATTSRR